MAQGVKAYKAVLVQFGNQKVPKSRELLDVLCYSCGGKDPKLKVSGNKSLKGVM